MDGFPVGPDAPAPQPAKRRQNRLARVDVARLARRRQAVGGVTIAIPHLAKVRARVISVRPGPTSSRIVGGRQQGLQGGTEGDGASHVASSRRIGGLGAVIHVPVTLETGNSGAF
jgi:hypothetical protein